MTYYPPSAISGADALNYRGTWNPHTNVPPLADGVGAKNDYYICSHAGHIVLDGNGHWLAGEWVVFDGTAWRRGSSNRSTRGRRAILKPGATTLDDEGVYGSWEDLMHLAHHLDHPVTVELDTDLGPIVVPAGTHEFPNGTTFAGHFDLPFSLITFDDGAVLEGVTTFHQGVALVSNSNSPVILFDDGASHLITFERGVSIECRGTGPFVQSEGGSTLVVAALYGAELIDAGFGTPVLYSHDSGTMFVNPVVTSPLPNNTLGSSASGIFLVQAYSHTQLGATQPDMLGTYIVTFSDFATQINFDNTVEGLLAATTVQAAIDEVSTMLGGGLNYQGSWNAATNTPALADGVGTQGDYYIVSVAGSTSLDGITDWDVNDWLIFNGTIWQKLDQSGLQHAATHQNGGGDEINVGGLSGELADPQPPKTHATSHENGGGDEISVAGLSGLLADPQTPDTHATSHQSGGGDAIKIDDLAAPDDNTDLNATAAAHGLLPKLSGNSAEVLLGDGTWGTAASGLDGSVGAVDNAALRADAGTGEVQPSDLTISDIAFSEITIQPAASVTPTRITLKGADATSPATGAYLRLLGGNGFGGANGGAVTTRAGDAGTFGTGGEVTISGGSGGSSTGGTGGAVSLTAGSGISANANGGAATVQGGNGFGSADGGNVTVTGGAGGTTSGNGGTVNITGGNAAAGNSAGGNVNIGGGVSTGNGTGGSVSVDGGTGGTTGNGGVASLRGGNGGSTSGAGGAANISGGNATAASASGGNVNIAPGTGGTTSNGGSSFLRGGNAGATSGIGGGAYVIGGVGRSGGVGGIVTILGGTAGATGTGGAVTITGGAGGTTSGNGGSVTIGGGNASTGNSAGGATNITSGNGKGTQPGGIITIQPGLPGTTGSGAGINITARYAAAGSSGSGGSIALDGGPGGGVGGSGGSIHARGGAASGGSSAGGSVTNTGGKGFGSGIGGSVTYIAGQGGATGNGGAVTITGGAGGTTSGNGGSVTIGGGNATAGGGNGGVLTLQGGLPNGGGTVGKVAICRATETLSFFAGAGTTKQTISGSRGGNAALASLLTALAAHGLITDSTSA